MQKPSNSSVNKPALRAGWRHAFMVPAFFLLAACQTMQAPQVEVSVPTTVRPQQPATDRPANGAIFQAGSYRPFFEDFRARNVGDILTVNIVEKTNAVQKQSSSVDKAGSIVTGATALGGVSAAGLANVGFNTSSANKMAGKGDSNSSNDFSGVITATVIEVLPNGNLRIAGEKQLGVNATVEVLKFSGVVDPRSIGAGNTVQSTQIADARIQFRGQGQLADTQKVGWLGRFFLSLWPL